jgi:hypothetical protein
MTRTLVTALMVATAVLIPVRAQQRQEADYRVYGAGSLPCREWVEAQRKADPTRFSTADIYQVWIVGFVSGAGYAGLTLKGSNSEGMKAFVDQYCAARPSDTIATAAAALVRGLRTKAP